MIKTVWARTQVSHWFCSKCQNSWTMRVFDWMTEFPFLEILFFSIEYATATCTNCNFHWCVLCFVLMSIAFCTDKYCVLYWWALSFVLAGWRRSTTRWRPKSMRTRSNSGSVISVFLSLGRARRSRDGLMESWVCHHHWHAVHPTHTLRTPRPWTPLALRPWPHWPWHYLMPWWVACCHMTVSRNGARSAFTLTKRTCIQFTLKIQKKHQSFGQKLVFGPMEMLLIHGEKRTGQENTEFRQKKKKKNSHK